MTVEALRRRRPETLGQSTRRLVAPIIGWRRTQERRLITNEMSFRLGGLDSASNLGHIGRSTDIGRSTEVATCAPPAR
jgi:hypothetical protein